jgi:uncharacterized protein
MTSKPFLAATLQIFLVVAPATAEAASFNCAKAAKLDEKAICASSKLSGLDIEMATLYRVRMELPMLMGARGAAQDQQRAFLTQREQCGSNVACIEAAYTNRIATLSQTIKAAMQDYCAKLGICG